MGKEYEIAFNFGAKVQSSFHKFFGTAQRNFKGINKQMSGTEKYAKKTTKAFNGMGKSLKTVAGIAGTYVGIRAVKNFASDSVDAAKMQIEAETKLQSVLKNTKGITDEHISNLKKYAGVQQNIGVIGDEIQIAGMQQIGTFQLQADTIKTLTPGMNDLLAQQKGLNATQSDAVNIGNMIGKVMNGQVGALSRVGINFTKAQEKVLKFGNEQEKAAALAQVLKQNVGGVNKALAETDTGAIKQATNMWGDMKEVIGKGILKVLGKTAKWFSKYMPAIQDKISFVGSKARIVIDTVKKVATNAFNKVKEVIKNNGPAIDMIKNGFFSLKNMIMGVKDFTVDAFIKIKERIAQNQPTIDRVKEILSNLGDKALIVKGYLIDAFEAARPAIEWLKNEGLPGVVDFIAKVVDKAVGLYDYINNNWNNIKPIVLGISGAIALYKATIMGATLATKIHIGVTKGLAVVTKGLAIVQGILNGVMNMSPLGWICTIIGLLITAGIALYQNWDTIKAKALELWQGLQDAFGKVGEFFSGIWEGVKQGALNAVDWIKEKFNGFVEFIKGIGRSIANFFIRPINSIISGINKINIKIPKGVPIIGGTSFGFNIPQIPELAKGGFIKHRPGGILANIGEGKEDEAVMPLSKLNDILFKSKNKSKSKAGINITYSPQYIIHGNADETTLKKVNKKSSDDFERRFNNLINNNNRLCYQ
ncbi:MAG: hypothetical protein N4A63_07130 [Vallitalea sp.]|nr:hypothetical protein [Vallitalea sp.]